MNKNRSSKRLTRLISSLFAIAVVLFLNLTIFAQSRFIAEIKESFPLTGIDKVHEMGVTGYGITILVIDNFSFPIPALTNIEFYHGKYVEGIIRAVAPGASVITCDAGILNKYNIDETSCLEMIRTNTSIKIVNMSFGAKKYTEPCSPAPNQKIIEDFKDTVSFVAASGNNKYTDGISYPACIPNVISVGAVYDGRINFNIESLPCGFEFGETDKVTCYSNSAYFLDILAPGGRIDIPELTKDLNILQKVLVEHGTSWAAPIVSGTIALMLEVNPCLTPSEIDSILKDTGKHIKDHRNGITFPRINALKAVKEAKKMGRNCKIPPPGYLPPIIPQPPVLNPPPILPSCKASPKISVKPKSGFPGTPFTVKWTGFSDNGTLVSHLQKPDGTEYPTKTFTVDRKGKAEFVIDSSTFTPGQYNLWAEDTCTGKRTKTVSFTIKGPVSPPVQPPPSTCPPGTTGTPPNCTSPVQPPTPGPTNNPPQIIEFSINPSPATVGLLVVFVGVAIDEMPERLKFLWSFGDGSTSTDFATTYFYNSAGLFNVCLTVTDPQGLQAQKCQQLQVIGESTASPQPPTTPPQPPSPPKPVDSDNDGIPDNQDQCPYQRGPAPTGCPAATQPPPQLNQPPWAQIEVFPRTVNVGEFVTIQVISYSDPEGQPLAFDYDFGDGTVISSPAAGERHKYSQPGTYTVQAKVRDPQGAFSYTNSVSVTVIGQSSPPPSLPLIDSDDDGIPDNQDQCPYAWGPPPLGCPATAQPPSPPTRQSPIAQFTMSADGQTAFENEILWLEVLAGTTVTVRFSAGRSFDPDGTIVSYQWFINGTPVSRSRDFSFDLGANAPQHLIHLIITDNDGQKAEVGATIIVEEIIGLDDPPWLFGLKNNIGFTSVQVYSVQGKLVYQFEEIPPHRRWQWDMRDQYGTRVSNGIYLAVITVRDLSGYPIRREVKKIVVLR